MHLIWASDTILFYNIDCFQSHIHRRVDVQSVFLHKQTNQIRPSCTLTFKL